MHQLMGTHVSLGLDGSIDMNYMQFFFCQRKYVTANRFTLFCPSEFRNNSKIYRWRIENTPKTECVISNEINYSFGATWPSVAKHRLACANSSACMRVVCV